MTPAELKAYIATQLTAPVNEVSKLIDSLNAMVDFITSEVAEIIPDWNAALTFQSDGSDDGSYCLYADTNGKLRIWETKVDDNINNLPPSAPGTVENAYWIEVSSSASAAIPEWAPGLFGPGLIIVYHNHSTDGRGLYVLLEPVRPFASADIEAEITAGDWEQISGGSSGSAPAGTVVLCGNYDASTNTFPTSGGTGTAGAIKKGNEFDISVAGTLGGEAVPIGATIRAKIDTPGNTLANWRIFY